MDSILEKSISSNYKVTISDLTEKHKVFCNTSKIEILRPVLNERTPDLEFYGAPRRDIGSKVA